MKQMLLIVLLCLLSATTAAAAILERPTTAGFVFDYSNVIDEDVEAELNDFALALQQSGKLEIFFITVGTIGDYEPYEYGMEIFRTWGIGDPEKNNGILIYVTTDMPDEENTVRFATGAGAGINYPDGRTGELIDTYMMPSLEINDYTTAFAQVAEAIRQQEELAFDWENTEKFTPEDDTDYSVYFVFGVIALFFIYSWIKKLVRGIQGRYYARHLKKTGKDIRSPSYIKYEEERKAAAAAAIATSYDSNDYNDYSSSNDSYSGSGGDSDGGGSDRHF
ncbi:TPM domain-containing protein [Caryophanon latum]|uniref:TPM domain-containing protein n=1 Tax=Caryophanon latum TaxID=33977 RepID=A0A1C0Z377_9BACL|nr:TPM domain-containing protein [Caryophanon latum]OCS93750.1 hypothetical protein A6K76_04425 [Caryophanon latum]